MILPGQSLTAEPKNAPYENPPEMTNPDDAVMWHLERLTEEDRMEALFDILELGMDVVTITEGLLRGAVMEGRHSIDVSMIIAPIIHEFVVSSAKQAGIEYEEGFPDDSEKRDLVKYQINSRKASKKLAELDMEVEDEGLELDVEEGMSMSEEEVEMDTVKEAPKGLMARKGDKA